MSIGILTVYNDLRPRSFLNPHNPSITCFWLNILFFLYKNILNPLDIFVGFFWKFSFFFFINIWSKRLVYQFYSSCIFRNFKYLYISRSYFSKKIKLTNIKQTTLITSPFNTQLLQLIFSCNFWIFYCCNKINLLNVLSCALPI